MKIVRDKTGHVARYAFADDADVSITTGGLTGPGVIALDIKTAKHEIVTAPSPGIFVPGAMAFDGTAWSITDPDAYAASPVVAQANALIEAYKAAIKDHIEAAAHTRQYDGTVSIATYVNSTVPAWAAEAQAFIAWRDAVWAYALAELASVMSGQRAMPTIEALIDELPDLVWPE